MLAVSDTGTGIPPGVVERIKLVVADVVMPGIGGRVFAETAQAQFPELKVLFISGYPDDEVLRHGVMHGKMELLEKPFRIDALVGKVNQMLALP